MRVAVHVGAEIIAGVDGTVWGRHQTGSIRSKHSSKRAFSTPSATRGSPGALFVGLAFPQFATFRTAARRQKVGQGDGSGE